MLPRVGGLLGGQCCEIKKHTRARDRARFVESNLYDLMPGKNITVTYPLLSGHQLAKFHSNDYGRRDKPFVG